MGPKAKITTITLMFLIVALALWQFTSPTTLPPVGTKYLNTPYDSRGGWAITTASADGRLSLAFSITNLTYPRPSLSTTYSLIISKINETITNNLARSISLRVTSLSITDNYDGTVTAWGRTNNYTDAIQATSLFFFHTSATHQLKLTITYQLYNLLLLGYTPDHTETRSFNITQTIV